MFINNTTLYFSRTKGPWSYFLIIYFYLVKPFFYLYFLYINTCGRETTRLFVHNFDGGQLVTVWRLYCLKDAQYRLFSCYSRSKAHWIKMRLLFSPWVSKALETKSWVPFVGREFITRSLHSFKQVYLWGWKWLQFRI